MLNKEIWAKTVSPTLYPENEFLSFLPNHAEFVDGKYVHIPIYGDNQGINPQINPSYPLTGTITVTNEEKLVTLNRISAGPIVLNTPIEELELNYDKRAAVLMNSMLKLKETIADSALLDLGATTGITVVSATGSGRTALDSNQTGTRKAITAADVMALRLLFDKQNVPMAGRYLVIPSDFQKDIFDFSGFIKASLLVNSAESVIKYPDMVGELYGFKVLVRSRVILTNSTGVTQTASNKFVDFVGSGATLNQAAIAFSDQTCGKALGDVEFFARIQDPYFQSNIISYFATIKAFSMYNSTVAKGLAVLTEVA